MNERDDAFQFHDFERIIGYRSRGFGRQTAVPLVGMKSVTDLDLVHPVQDLAEKSAITDQPIFFVEDQCKLTGRPGVRRRDDALKQKASCYSRVKTPLEKRMKSAFAISAASAARSSSTKMAQDQPQCLDNGIHCGHGNGLAGVFSAHEEQF